MSVLCKYVNNLLTKFSKNASPKLFCLYDCSVLPFCAISSGESMHFLFIALSMSLCCAVNCGNRSSAGYITKRFPTNPDLQASWANNIGRKNYEFTQHSYLCEVSISLIFSLFSKRLTKAEGFEKSPQAEYNFVA